MKRKYIYFSFVWIGILSMSLASAEPTWFEAQRREMVEKQIMARGIQDPEVLKAMREVKRHLFVPWEYRLFAYRDGPLRIGYHQTISQPYIVAYMTEALELSPDDKVLEVGTGSGYQAAVLAKIVQKVYSIELIPELAEEAGKKLKRLGYHNVTVKQGDGYLGWEEQAPFDAIIVTAAPKTVPQKLLAQLKDGGRMILPVGDYSQELFLIERKGEKALKRKLIPVRFVPLVQENKEA